MIQLHGYSSGRLVVCANEIFLEQKGAKGFSKVCKALQ